MLNNVVADLGREAMLESGLARASSYAAPQADESTGEAGSAKIVIHASLQADGSTGEVGGMFYAIKLATTVANGVTA